MPPGASVDTFHRRHRPFLYSSADLVRPFQAAGRFGAHADFVNGWDQETLEALVATLN